MRSRWPIIALILAPLALLWRCVFFGETIGPWAEVSAFAPWSNAPPDRPFDVLQMDAALQFYVWRDLVFDSWRHLQVPWWNPYTFGGAPLLANSQSGALYPPHILIGILQIPTGVGITLLAWFHLSLAGLGVYALGRRCGGADWAAFVGGISFSLSAFMTSWTGLGSVISTVAWIPWILVALDRRLQPEIGALGGRKASVRDSVTLAILVAFMFLAGHLQFAAFGGMALAIYWIVGVFEVRLPWKQALWPLPPLALGTLLAWPQISAVLRYSQLSHRRGVPTSEGWAAYQASGTQWWEWASVGSGDLLGSPATWAPGKISSFWPSLLKPGGNYAESALAVGIVVLTLAGVSLLRGQRGNLRFAAVALFGALVASASPLAQALYFGFPGWSATGSPGRASALVVMGLCLLAASWQPSQEATREENWHWLVGPGIAVVGICGILGFAEFLPNWAGMSTDQFGQILHAGSGQFGGMGIAIVGAVVLGGVAIKAPQFLPATGMGLGLIALVPGLLSAPLRSGHVPRLPERVPPGTRVAMINQDWSLFVLPKALMPPNLAAIYRIKEVGGYDSLVSRDIVARLRILNGGADPAPPENGNMMFIKVPDNISNADADEIWTQDPVEGWESRLIGRLGTAYRYRSRSN